MTHYIIEGVDRLGKSTLIQNLQELDGPYMVQHFSKPLISSKIKNNLLELGQKIPEIDHYPSDQAMLKGYQIEAFINGFKHLESTDIPTIYDRFHLGETIYAPLYREYNGDYVYSLEDMVKNTDVRLVLLVTSDFSFISDDGQSLDVTNRQKEQDMFIAAFHKSNIENKIIIDVNYAGVFIDPMLVRDLAVNSNVKTCDRRIEPRD